jgi:hypothetical protein
MWLQSTTKPAGSLLPSSSTKPANDITLVTKPVAMLVTFLKT